MATKQSQKVINWRRRTKQRIVESFGGKCCICGYDRFADSLALHHLDPSKKERSLGGIRANPTSWDKIVIELRKCIMVCHNCHSELHGGFIELPENLVRFDESYIEYKKNKCPVCGKLKFETNKTCSAECAGYINAQVGIQKKLKRNNMSKIGKVEWHKIDLIKLKETMSNVAIGEMLGVSEAAVRKRLKKINTCP